MSEKHPLREEIQKAWGYDDYMRDQYNTFQDYIRERFQECSHEKASYNYSDAALNLETLVKKVYNENN